MTRRLALTAILLLAAAALCAQDITVTAPAAGAAWDISSTQTIRWTHSRRTGATVKIILVATAGGLTTIADPTDNDDQYEWPIASSVAPGVYFIRVKTTDNVYKGESGRFTIREAGSPPPPPPPGTPIRVIHPAAGETFCLNQANLITWDTGGIVSPVYVKLLQDGRPPLNLVYMGTNLGRILWTPEPGTPGGSGRIQVYPTANGDLQGTGEPFTLATCATFTAPLQSFTPCLTISSPARDARLAIGQYHEIRWNTRAGADCGARLQLTAVRQSDNFEIPIRGGLDNAAGDHTYSWLIDVSRYGDHPGPYRVRARSVSGAVADSAVFEVTTEGDPSGRTPAQDLILSLDPSSIEVSHMLGRGDTAHDMYRMHVTLRMRNATHTPSGGPMPEIREVKCNWRVQTDNNGTWDTLENPRSEYWGSQPFWVGPIRCDEWTEQRITIDFYVFRYSSVKRRIRFTLDPDHETNDPVRDNNVAFSAEIPAPDPD